ncbi:copper transporter [Ornithinimicrobium sp. INDO-MA30-4]|uniref:copper transporter n=1 Tax=Ornithinimicrobium sp. INDO-MA30-4 TaxID=2908651 RepID=UPI001F450E0A|nr:copper transporter [Ornithinimicrobium sp. INDO-MA30-4]UJH70980.1 copper transporter [Ornithinimicrobium sp. INDO-MA30-4]
MIDFRYHVVSLVAVFIALAVGIVLGAGPLRGQLSDTIEGQVAELGEERNVLRADLALQERRADTREDLLDEVTPDLVAGLLTDQSVAVVELPDADTDAADDLALAVTQAGGTVAPRLQILNDWDDPELAEERAAAAQEMSAVWGAGFATPENATAEATLATAITGWGPDGSVYSGDLGQSILEEAGFISVSRAGSGAIVPGTSAIEPVSMVILVAGSSPEPESADTDAEPQETSLVQALGQTDSAILVAGEGTEQPSGNVEALAAHPLLSTVRADSDLASEVSTVDNVDSALGRLSVVWSLAWLASDQVGHFGFADDAGASSAPDPVTTNDRVPTP